MVTKFLPSKKVVMHVPGPWQMESVEKLQINSMQSFWKATAAKMHNKAATCPKCNVFHACSNLVRYIVVQALAYRS